MFAPIRILFLLSLFPIYCHADDWVCPYPEDDFCDAYHAEYLVNQADKRLNEVYKKLLSDYPDQGTKGEMEFTKIAQRAWLKYSEAHCAAILSKFAGAPFTKAEMEYTCQLELINKRIKELESYCESCSTPSPNPQLHINSSEHSSVASAKPYAHAPREVDSDSPEIQRARNSVPFEFQPA